MVLSPVQQKLIIWARNCSHAIGDHFDGTIATLNENGRPAHEYELLLRQLIISCHLSSESVFLLVSNCKLWDAEAVLRSVVEGTFKTVYLCVGSKEDIKAKFKEFGDDLPEINRIKRHTRLHEFLTHAPDADSDRWKPFRDLLLSDEEFQRLGTAYPKAKLARHRVSKPITRFSVRPASGSAALLIPLFSLMTNLAVLTALNDAVNTFILMSYEHRV